MDSYTLPELSKMTDDLLDGLVWMFEQNPKDKEWFYSYFQFKRDKTHNCIDWYSTMKTKIPDEYHSQISSYFAGNYNKIFYAHNNICASVFKEKPISDIYAKLLNDAKMIYKGLTKLDSEVSQYTGLLKLGYRLRTGFDTCQAVILAPCDIDKYLDIVEKNYMVVDIEQYRKEIIKEFATYCKEKELELRYNFPHTEIILPHIFNDIFQKNKELIENNEKYSAVLNEIRTEMNKQ